MTEMNPNPKPDPSVELLIKLFPEEFLRKTASETGFIQRQRKINPVIFFWVIVFGFGMNFLREIRGLKRKYEAESKTKLSISSFNERFTSKTENFLKKCVIYALEFQAQEPGLRLGDRLKNFKDILIQDNTIIRLHESLANLWPAARSKKIAAGLKLSCVISVAADSVKTVRLFSERTAEVKTLRLGSWLKDRILLIDLGFFNYTSFDRIEHYCGFFVSRLKGNANPKIVGINRNCKGNSIDVIGKKLREVLPLLKREVLDVIVEVEVKRRTYKRKRTKIIRTFRLICILNEDTGKYHIYLTNIPVDVLVAEDIANLYSTRWEIDLIFKELKNVYHVDEITSANPYIVKCLIWAAILTVICSRRILRLVKNVNPKNAYRYTHLRWAKVFMENADRLLREILESLGYIVDKITLSDIWIEQGCDPNIKRKRLMDAWIA